MMKIELKLRNFEKWGWGTARRASYVVSGPDGSGTRCRVALKKPSVGLPFLKDVKRYSWLEGGRCVYMSKRTGARLYRRRSKRGMAHSSAYVEIFRVDLSVSLPRQGKEKS